MDLKISIFLLLFMSVGLGLYFIVPKKYRWIVVLSESVIFYALYSKFMSFFILATVLIIYFIGLWISALDQKFQTKKEGLEKEERKALKKKIGKAKKWVTALGIVLNLAILAVLKYSGFFASIFEGFFSWFKWEVHLPILKVVLPLGISYYTLSSIGYMVDVCRGKYPADKNFFRVSLFVLYFPQLLEGPFAFYDKLAFQLYDGAEFDAKRISSGFLLVLWGFFKKAIIADRFAIIVTAVFKGYASYSGIIILIGIIAFTIQLYAEFSGIIDVVRGISEMYGFNLEKNFEQPFFSQTVNEFWRRWHISLGAWFREYIFYPISMSKGFMNMNKKLHGKVSQFFEVFIPSLLALFVVWLLNGLWHGASIKYVVYGLYYYVIMMIGMCFEPLFNLIYNKTKINKDHWTLKTLRIIRTLIIVNIGMLIFRAPTLADSFKMFTGMFTNTHMNSNLLSIIDIGDLVVALVSLVCLVVVDFLQEFKINIREKFASSHFLLKYACLLVLIFAIIIFGAYGDGYVAVDPIYGGF